MKNWLLRIFQNPCSFPIPFFWKSSLPQPQWWLFYWTQSVYWYNQRRQNLLSTRLPPNQFKTPNLPLLLTKLCIHEVSFKESSVSPCTERILTNREKLHLLPTFWLCLGLMAFLCFSGKPFALGPAAKVEHHKRSFQSNSQKPYAGIQNSLHTWSEPHILIAI